MFFFRSAQYNVLFTKLTFTIKYNPDKDLLSFTHLTHFSDALMVQWFFNLFIDLPN